MDTCGLAPFVEDSPIITVIENFGSSDESEVCLDKLQQIFGQLLVAHTRLRKRDLDNRVYFAVELDPSKVRSTPENHFRSFKKPGDFFPASWTFENNIDPLPNHYLFSIPKDHEQSNMLVDIGPHEERSNFQRRSPDHIIFRRDLEDLGVKFLEILEKSPLKSRAVIPVPDLLEKRQSEPNPNSTLDKVANELDIEDPLFPNQWHLVNTQQTGHDINVTGLWLQGITGKDIVVSVIDDGVEADHPDFEGNFFANASYDFNRNIADPSPEYSTDYHGTRCAGEISAGKNSACGLGVAYDSKIAGVKILSDEFTSLEEASAIAYRFDQVDVYSCSWGAEDTGSNMDQPAQIVLRAMKRVINEGRDGKGGIYVVAAGNGALYGDSCAFDGYANNIYSITIGAITRFDEIPSYSEACSAVMAVTYSSELESDFIYTTDINGGCSNKHSGTSAATPLAAGMFALALQINPELTWRDMQYLVWDTAIPVGNLSIYQETPSGKKFHPAYGFGKLNAGLLVERAKTWKNVKPQAFFASEIKKENATIVTDGETMSNFTIEVTREDIEKANFERLEHVQIRIGARADSRGNLTIGITSPSGVFSDLMPFRPLDDAVETIHEWDFMTVANWGGDPVGTWTLSITNKDSSLNTATLNKWQLRLWGESADASKAEDPAKLGESTTSTSTGTATSSSKPTSTSGSSSQTISGSGNSASSVSKSGFLYITLLKGFVAIYVLGCMLDF